MVKHSYEVCETGWQPNTPHTKFEPFILEVPAPDHTTVSEARSARRAYFSAMSLLRHLEPEDWQLFDWTESFGRGAERDMSGKVKAPAI